MGQAVLEQLHPEKVALVVIEQKAEVAEELRSEGYLVIQGDATEDRTLLAAGVEKARAIVTALPEDAGNVFIVITAKDLNPNIRVIARGHRTESISRLKRAGAETVVSPSAIAGSRMALAALKPSSVAFIQTLIDRRNLSLVLEEVLIPPQSPLVGKPIRESRLREDYNAQVVAIDRNGEIIQTPPPDSSIMAGDVLMLLGPGKSLAKLDIMA